MGHEMTDRLVPWGLSAKGWLLLLVGGVLVHGG